MYIIIINEKRGSEFEKSKKCMEIFGGRKGKGGMLKFYYNL